MAVTTSGRLARAIAGLLSDVSSGATHTRLRGKSVVVDLGEHVEITMTPRFGKLIVLYRLDPHNYDYDRRAEHLDAAKRSFASAYRQARRRFRKTVEVQELPSYS